MKDITHSTEQQREKAFLVAVDTGDDPGWDAEESLVELAALVETAGAEVVGTMTQNRESLHPAWYMGKGKAEELKAAKGSDAIHLAGDRRRTLTQAAEDPGRGCST